MTSLRIEMNSPSLQNHFKEVYREFFSKNDLVVSGCFNFTWGPLLEKPISNFLRLKSKTPLKCYIGIKKIPKSSQVVFGGIQYFDIVSKNFKYYPYDSVNKEMNETKKCLENFLSEHGYDGGLEIQILSETTRGHSFGFSGTSSAILSALVHIVVNNIDRSQIRGTELFFKPDDLRQIYMFAWKLERIERYGNTLGQNSYNTLSNTKIPNFLLMEDISHFDTEAQFENASFEHGNILNKFGLTGHCDDLLLDYAIVFSGIPTNSHQVEQTRVVTKTNQDSIKTFIDHEILGNIAKKENFYLNHFLADRSIISYYTDIISLINIKTIQNFKIMYESGFDEREIERFIDNINEYKHVSYLLGDGGVFMDDFIYLFRKNQKSTTEMLGIMPIYSGKFGGGYVVVTKFGKSRDTLEKVLADLSGTYSGVELEYASYLDGECSDGIKIEQYLSEKMYSSHVSGGSYTYSDNQGNNYVGRYDEIFEKETDGLILDTIERKVYFQGQKLTSKDIPSQNAIIDVLCLVYNNSGNEVSNAELPVSGYSKNKNEMLSKVILPFTNFIEEKTKAPFLLDCRGSLGDFYFKLAKTPVKIGVIRSI